MKFRAWYDVETMEHKFEGSVSDVDIVGADLSRVERRLLDNPSESVAGYLLATSVLFAAQERKNDSAITDK